MRTFKGQYLVLQLPGMVLKVSSHILKLEHVNRIIAAVLKLLFGHVIVSFF